MSKSWPAGSVKDAWLTLVHVGEPDGDPRKAAQIQDASAILMEWIPILLKKLCGNAKKRGIILAVLAERCGGEDVTKLTGEISIQIVAFLGRVSACRATESARIVALASAGRPVGRLVVPEAWRQAEFGVSARELSRRWEPAGVPTEVWAENYASAIEQTGTERYWIGRFRELVFNTVRALLKADGVARDRDERVCAKLSLSIGAQEAAAKKCAPSGQPVASLADCVTVAQAILMDRIGERWLVQHMFPAARGCFPKKCRQIDRFERVFFAHASDMDAKSHEPATVAEKRSARRGRGALCGALLFWMISQPLPSSLKRSCDQAEAELLEIERAVSEGLLTSAKSETRRLDVYNRWVGAVVEDQGLGQLVVWTLRDVLLSLSEEKMPAFNNDLPGDVAYGVLACHVIMDRGRRRRPKGPTAAVAPLSPGGAL